MPSRPSQVLAALAISLSWIAPPAGSYQPVAGCGDGPWVSGQEVLREGRARPPGLVHPDVSIPDAQSVAPHATLQGLGALATTLWGIARVARVLRVGVFVASSPGFARPHEVANGATDLLIQLFGENGRPSRVAVEVTALPLNAPVEVEPLVASS